LVQFVVGQTAVEHHIKERARVLVAGWEELGVETAVSITRLETAIETVQK
jgi:hypothetical protein